MNEADKIIKSHNIKRNIKPQQWFTMVYNYPDFTSYELIPDNDHCIMGEPANTPIMAKVTESRYVSKIINGQRYLCPKYFVPLKNVHNAYNAIDKANNNPEANPNKLLAYAYFALVLSMLIFSFRVTSGRSWLISVVVLFVTGIITGVFLMTLPNSITFILLWGLIITGLLIYFIYINVRKTEKAQSMVVLNILLWLITALIPAIYITVHEIMTKNDVYEKNGIAKDIVVYGDYFMIIAAMYFLTVQIKKWKGIAEG